MSRDPQYYDNPDTFDGYRFYRTPASKQKISQPPEYEFTGIERGNVAWGNGRLTCPGRWYASAMNKLVVASLLLRYDISFPEGQSTRPPNVYNDASILPSPTREICIRSRLQDP